VTLLTQLLAQVFPLLCRQMPVRNAAGNLRLPRYGLRPALRLQGLAQLRTPLLGHSL
jgi:hypothetical protein